MADKNIPGSVYVKAGNDYSAAVGVVGERKAPTTVTVENTEMMEKMNNTKYPTYTVGTRVLLDTEGLKIPLLCKSSSCNDPRKTNTVFGINK